MKYATNQSVEISLDFHENPRKDEEEKRQMLAAAIFTDKCREKREVNGSAYVSAFFSDRTHAE